MPDQLRDSDKTDFTYEDDRRFVCEKFESTIRRLANVRDDADGFQQYLEQADIVWLRVDYVTWRVTASSCRPAS